jgi:beta-glucosidase
MTDPLLSQSSTRAEDGDRTVDPELAARARYLAARGTVLLRNEHDVLPLAPRTRVALFGRVQADWFAVGFGSGGDVNVPYRTTLLEAMREAAAASDGITLDEDLAGVYESWIAQNPAVEDAPWGQWPRSHPEMPLEDRVVREAAERDQVAVVSIGRAAGEDRENVLEPGSYYLTDAERTLLSQVTSAFERTVVVLDTGNVVDLSWVEQFPIDAVVLAWFGGMEGGRAVADVLTGVVEPGGRLTDTIARHYEDYPSSDHFGDPDGNDYVEDVFVGYRYFETFAPDKVLFPFGFGLGYTTFDLTPGAVTTDGPTIRVPVTVTNTGERTGSQVAQVYVHAPQYPLATPSLVLVGFARTGEIAPGAEESVEVEVPLRALAAYDESGLTGHRSAWVVQEGTYTFLVGADVRAAAPAGVVSFGDTRVLEQLEEVAAVEPDCAFDRLTLAREADGTVIGGQDGIATAASEPVPTRTVDLAARILDRLPEAITPSADGTDTARPDTADGTRSAGPTFDDVAAGRAELDELVANLSPEELSCLAYGDVTMDSPLGAAGNAGAFGGVTEQLRARGIPAAITTDGPSGIRISAFASLLPCGTALASAWDPEAVQALAALHGKEMLAKGSDVLLSPGMNIHRDPLCGRNFEYFSEDPLVTGLSATAVVQGLQSQGVSACPKHFAANNQETNRTWADSRVSERALREIYLRGFEICVREARPKNLMTSYNRINGVWGHYHYELVTTVLRDEWGYEGNVVTDWWMRMAPDPHFPALKDSAYRVRAQVDVLMPGGDAHGSTTREDTVLESFRSPDGITLGELQRTARNVLRFLLTLDGTSGQQRAAQGLTRGSRRQM